MAAMAVSAVAKAVTTITWVSGCRCFDSDSTSSPLPSGILRSVMTTSNSRAAIALRAASASAAASTRCPLRLR